MNKKEKQVIFEILCELNHLSCYHPKILTTPYQKVSGKLHDLRFDRYTWKGKIRSLLGGR